MTPALDTRQKVNALEAEVCKLPQVNCPVRHYLAPGMYAREITIPAGTVLIGAVHRVQNIAVLSAGRLRLVIEGGSIEIAAPHTIVIAAGAKNAAVALETAVWTNFLPNPDNETDTDKLAARYTESKASDLIGGSTNQQLTANKAVEIEA